MAVGVHFRSEVKPRRPLCCTESIHGSWETSLCSLLHGGWKASLASCAMKDFFAWRYSHTPAWNTLSVD